MMREFKYRPEKFDHFQLVYHFTVPLKNYKKTFRLKSLNTCFFFKKNLTRTQEPVFLIDYLSLFLLGQYHIWN